MTTDFRRRPLFDDDHHLFRDSVRSFLTRHVVDHIDGWDRTGDVPRDLWNAAGEAGFLGLGVPESYGGGGIDDFRFRVAMIEEFAAVGATSPAAGFSVHSDIALPYFIELATEEQGKRWLPGLAAGQQIAAIAMTEPAAGSDLRGLKTTATPTDGGWLLNGSKTFISNGINADLVIVVARTDSAEGGPLSLFVVEEGVAGFGRGRRLEKIGLKAQDTAELNFNDVYVSRDSLLGDEGGALRALMQRLPLERLGIAVTACAGARSALAWALDYVQQRTAFGKPLSTLQDIQFKLAEMATELDIAQAYVDDAVLTFNNHELSAVDAAKAKWWSTEMHKRTVDTCLQMFGGYGYMLEYPIARAYLDTRVTTIYGGTTEIMKTIIARDLLAPQPR